MAKMIFNKDGVVFSYGGKSIKKGVTLNIAEDQVRRYKRMGFTLIEEQKVEVKPEPKPKRIYSRKTIDETASKKIIRKAKGLFGSSEKVSSLSKVSTPPLMSGLKGGDV